MQTNRNEIPEQKREYQDECGGRKGNFERNEGNLR